MTRDRISTFGKPISFRLRPAQTYLLRKHELVAGEPAANIMNRQLKRLRQALLDGNAPVEPIASSGTKDDYHQLKPEASVVEPFIHAMREQRKWENDRVAVENLVPWSCELPIVVPLMSADELYQFLLSEFGDTETVLVRTALMSACDRCSLEQAKTWLWSLKKSKKLALSLSSEECPKEVRVRLPNRQGLTYTYLNLI